MNHLHHLVAPLRAGLLSALRGVVGMLVYTTMSFGLWANQPPANAASKTFDVMEYRVQGARKISEMDIEKAVYPYLGPQRTAQDVDQARAALEKAYQDQGYKWVSVQIPPQNVTGGVIVLQVSEGEVGRVRVQGARYHSPNEIRAQASSLQEGTVLDAKAFLKDYSSLNQSGDRQVAVVPKPGVKPGTIDLDLNVKDKFPLHGSLEFNNRYSPNTEQFRVNGSVSYHNLWQLGHTIGMSFQVAPENTDQVTVFSGYYMAPVPEVDWLTLMLQGSKQDTSVSTLGSVSTVGKGTVVGPRAIIDLPGDRNEDKVFFHNVTLGIDYKNMEQVQTVVGTDTSTPITYYPVNATYGANWIGNGYATALNSGVTAHLRGMGSSPSEFNDRRVGADGNFIYLRGDLSHTRDLPGSGQIFGKMQGQISDDALLDAEQLSAGGLDTVRGYLESEASGDDAVMGSVELRSPSLGQWLGKTVQEWRFYLFSEAARLTLHNPLPEQEAAFNLASFGVGSRVAITEHFNGSLDLGVPVLEGVYTTAWTPRFTFRVWADF